jgi:hypothetical protein
LSAGPEKLRGLQPGLVIFSVHMECRCWSQAVWLQKLDPKTDGAARDWVAIYDECSRILYQASGRGIGWAVIARKQ